MRVWDTGMTRAEKTAWLAGLLEGEGSFGAYHPKKTKSNPSLQMFIATLAMTDKDTVDRASLTVAELLGESPHVVRTRKRGKPHWTPCHVVEWCGQSAEMLAYLILPLMGLRRSARIEESLQACIKWRLSKRRISKCHPSRKHYSNGMCHRCWKAQYERRRRAAKRKSG